MLPRNGSFGDLAILALSDPSKAKEPWVFAPIFQDFSL
jgi:hypothetical protein